ncbi:MAG: trypsin-like peptidase domain-containing protein [Burkholderiaceae bacterium]|nr:trypsin-like peptidase domain-containing protein [Burkholderiaceae bacterium]
MPTYFSAEVGVDCANRTRIEYVSTSTMGGLTNTTSAATSDMRAVYEGTRQAQELTTVCALPPVSGPAVPSPVPSTLPTPSSVPQPARPRTRTSGTAFAVTADGVLATNYHVVDDCSGIGARVENTLRPVTILALDPQADLALVKIEGVTTIPLSISPRAPELGSSVIVLGYPLTSVLGTDVRVTSGIVSSLSGVRGERKNMQISAAVQPGNSGGPVLNERGEVVGIVVAKLADRFAAENVNFAVRAPLLRSLLEINAIEPPRQVAPTTSHTVSEVTRRGATSTYLLLCQ